MGGWSCLLASCSIFVPRLLKKSIRIGPYPISWEEAVLSPLYFADEKSQVSEKPNNLHEATEPVRGKSGLRS